MLVVIGIFLALQLNNWNAERKESDKEIGSLKEMRQNLESYLADCRYNINMNERMHSGCVAVLKHLEERTPFHDPLRVHYGNIFGSTVLTPNTSAFDNLKSIGFDLVKKDSLRRSITALYSERYTYLNKLETGYDAHLQSFDLGPQVYEKIVMDTVWKSGHPIDSMALMDDNAFKGVVRMNVFTRGYMVRIYQGFEKQILELMEMIEEELE
ncbi:MAG: hypothetical protein IPO56_10515 [Flavobacteriales bacterium]|nr:hypothetical protein [Flavobacteriales bacterium]